MKSEQADDCHGESPPSRATAGRLSLYLRRLEELLQEGAAKVSSHQLATSLGLIDTQVRKDLAHLGNLGHRGVGYRPQELLAAIRQTLGLDRRWPVVLVGVGHLAHALLRYRGFQQQGFRFVALIDADPAKIGQSLEGLTIQPFDATSQVIAQTGAEMGLLAVPASAAQHVADALVQAGIRGILNFAPTVLRLPPDVSLVSVDLAMQLEQLAFLVQRTASDACTAYPSIRTRKISDT